MVGAGTVRSDDPRLTCRVRGGRDPIRVVVDGRLAMSPRARVLRRASPAPTWIVTAADASRRRESALVDAGADVIRLPGRGRIEPAGMLRELGRRGITSVLVEGGSDLAGDLVRRGLVDELVLFVAPMLIGGDGVAAMASLGVRDLGRALRLRGLRIDRVGPDLMLRASLPLSPIAL
jgi:diaminohydroxyphosphoribosylaminopyrimidine deaminase/5-amino-6-(5-phosphoribosylamino)uracil reductase